MAGPRGRSADFVDSHASVHESVTAAPPGYIESGAEIPSRPSAFASVT